MIIANHTFKNRQEVIKMIGKRFETLLKEAKLTEKQAKELQKDIQENIVEAFTPTKFTENLETFFAKHPEFQEVSNKIKNLNTEYLQTTGNETIDILLDEDSEKWHQKH